jgi:hypothetical protein
METKNMYYQNWSELKKFNPVKDGKWDQELLYEYLVSSCYKNFEQPLNDFFSSYQNDEALAELLFDFLLNEEYDGSESQIGAAFYLSKFDKTILKKKKGLLLQAQQNPVNWKRPFKDNSYLEWL